MKHLAQWVLAGLLAVVITLQLVLIRKMPKQTEVPSLREIDSSISQWTMHHGQHFSSKSEVSELRGRVEGRLSTIEQKLDLLTKSKH
jgi:hypothetical protein